MDLLLAWSARAQLLCERLITEIHRPAHVEQLFQPVVLTPNPPRMLDSLPREALLLAYNFGRRFAIPQRRLAPEFASQPE